MTDYRKEFINAARLLKLKDEEIKRQIGKRILAEQVRNWTIIISIVVIVLIIVL